MKKILPIFLILPFLMYGDTKKELQKIRKKLLRVKKELRTLSRKEKNILKEMELLDQKVKLTRKLVEKLKENERELKRKIDSLNKEVEKTEASLLLKKEELKERLKFIYKKGEFFETELMLGAEDFSSLYSRYIYARIIARKDRIALEELKKLKTAIENAKKEVELSHTELRELISEKKATEDSLKNVKRKVKKKLRIVKKEKKKKERLKKQLEVAKRRLERMLAKMEKRRGKRKTKPGTHYVEKKRGNLPWPCHGRIISYFGKNTHPKYGTVTRNDGIDIKCKRGTKVRAISKGRVAFAERYLGYGNLIIIDHGDGYYSVYSNLDEILVSKGQKVNRGSVIGIVDDYLHFEFRVNAKAVNPLLWLK